MQWLVLVVKSARTFPSRCLILFLTLYSTMPAQLSGPMRFVLFTNWWNVWQMQILWRLWTNFSIFVCNAFRRSSMVVQARWEQRLRLLHFHQTQHFTGVSTIYSLNHPLDPYFVPRFGHFTRSCVQVCLALFMHEVDSTRLNGSDGQAVKQLGALPASPNSPTVLGSQISEWPYVTFQTPSRKDFI